MPFEKLMRIQRIAGASPTVYEIIGPFAMDPAIMKMRRNLPIVTKDTYTWHVLMRGKKVKAFIGMEVVEGYIKLQSCVVLDNDDEALRELLDDVIISFRKTDSPKLTVSVLNKQVSVFEKKRFRVVKYKKNWTDLEFDK